MPIQELEKRAYAAGCLASDIRGAMSGPTDSVQHGAVVSLLLKRQKQRKRGKLVPSWMKAAGSVSSAEEMFSRMDADQSGSLDRQELKAAIHELGFDLGPGGVDILFLHIDTDGDGAISLGEFREYWTEQQRLGNV